MSLKYFSTFTGIGGFEIGIQNAYRSKNRRSQTNPSGDEGQGLQPTPGQSITAEEGQPSERNNDRSDEGSLRVDNRPAGQNQEANAVENGVADPQSEYTRESPYCVGYSEIDKPAISVYEKQFKGTRNYGDITKINPYQLPDFDCLVGGFPCQAFSIAGKRGGFEDTRGTLFFDLARILRAKRPRLFVFENVKGLLSHDDGNTFRTIIATLDDLGYDLQWQVLNSKDWGVPQNRERIIIVGHLRGTTRPEVFPIWPSTEDSFEPSEDQEGSIAGTLTARQYANWSGNHIAQLNQPTHSNDRIYSPEGISPTLNTMQGGRRQPLVALSGDESRADSPTDTVGVRETTSVPRQLDEVSDTQRYKMAGNAVTTNVIQAVFERIL